MKKRLIHLFYLLGVWNMRGMEPETIEKKKFLLIDLDESDRETEIKLQHKDSDPVDLEIYMNEISMEENPNSIRLMNRENRIEEKDSIEITEKPNLSSKEVLHKVMNQAEEVIKECMKNLKENENNTKDNWIESLKNRHLIEELEEKADKNTKNVYTFIVKTSETDCKDLFTNFILKVIEERNEKKHTHPIQLLLETKLDDISHKQNCISKGHFKTYFHQITRAFLSNLKEILAISFTSMLQTDKEERIILLLEINDFDYKNSLNANSEYGLIHALSVPNIKDFIFSILHAIEFNLAEDNRKFLDLHLHYHVKDQKSKVALHITDLVVLHDIISRIGIKVILNNFILTLPEHNTLEVIYKYMRNLWEGENWHNGSLLIACNIKYDIIERDINNTIKSEIEKKIAHYNNDTFAILSKDVCNGEYNFKTEELTIYLSSEGLQSYDKKHQDTIKYIYNIKNIKKSTITKINLILELDHLSGDDRKLIELCKVFFSNLNTHWLIQLKSLYINSPHLYTKQFTSSTEQRCNLIEALKESECYRDLEILNLNNLFDFKNELSNPPSNNNLFANLMKTLLSEDLKTQNKVMESIFSICGKAHNLKELHLPNNGFILKNEKSFEYLFFVTQNTFLKFMNLDKNFCTKEGREYLNGARFSFLDYRNKNGGKIHIAWPNHVLERPTR
jgi:hypothetical protein